MRFFLAALMALEAIVATTGTIAQTSGYIVLKCTITSPVQAEWWYKIGNGRWFERREASWRELPCSAAVPCIVVDAEEYRYSYYSASIDPITLIYINRRTGSFLYSSRLGPVDSRGNCALAPEPAVQPQRF